MYSPGRMGRVRGSTPLHASVPISAAAMALSVGAGGALKGTKTTLLISLDEGVEALKKASSSGYTPVQK